MKYDYLKRKPTRGAERTLKAFSTTLFTLLAHKSFDSITVQEICDNSNYPRATFYNYFDDKYDLAQYCWYLIQSKLNLEEHHNLDPNEAIQVFFNRLYQLFSDKQALLEKIVQHNPLNSTLMQHFYSYFKQVMHDLFMECLDFQDHPVPLVILADHFSNTILLMFEWCFFKDECITLDEAHDYLQQLLSKI